MGLQSVKEKLDTIEAVSSTNDKKDLLKRYLIDPLFRRVVALAYSQGYTFNVNDATYVESDNPNDSVEEIFKYLDYLREKNGATNDEKYTLNYLASINKDTVEVVRRIVTKDLRAGFSTKLIESVASGIVYRIPYQRCSNYDVARNITYPAIIQKKADGMFVYGMPWKENMFQTRQGSTFHIYGRLRKQLTEIFGTETVIVGELQVLDENMDKVLDRKTGNGLLNSYIQGTGDERIADRIIYDIWSAIPYTAFLLKFYNVPYSSVFTSLQDKIDKWNDWNFPDSIGPINIVPFEIVHNLEEARKFYFKMRKSRFEGAILKDFSEVWEDKTSRKFVKMKNRVEAEFEIVGAYKGANNKKFSALLGGLTIATSDRGIVTNVGTGFSQKDREKGVDWWNDKIGMIVSVSFESVIEDKTERETSKLYIPAFEEARFHDKDTADTTEYCIGICNPENYVLRKKLVKK